MFKQLKSLFIEEGKNAKKEAVAAEEVKEAEIAENQDIVPESATPVEQADATTAPTPTEGKVSSKFMDVLLGAMEKNNVEGYDYLEFKKSLKNLAKVGNMDEGTRFQSAFAVAQPLGVNKAKLLETANFYLKILQDEETRFETALKNQRSKQIGSREEHIQKLAQSIEQKKKQIEQLQKEIAINQKEMDKIKSEISSSVTKVEGTKSNFVASYITSCHICIHIIGKLC